MQEEFRDVEGYEGLYQISNLGIVKSLPRNVYRKNGKLHYTKEEKIMSLSIRERYLGLMLYKDSVGKNFHIHQLLAITFLNHKPCGYKLVVDHIDNNPLNNQLDNLQIISARLNSSKDKKNGTSKYIGVSWSKVMKKWLSCIVLNGKIKVLGYFEDELEASEKYNNFLKTI